jgi:hypothetical protein
MLINIDKQYLAEGLCTGWPPDMDVQMPRSTGRARAAARETTKVPFGEFCGCNSSYNIYIYIILTRRSWISHCLQELSTLNA